MNDRTSQTELTQFAAFVTAMLGVTEPTMVPDQLARTWSESGSAFVASLKPYIYEFGEQVILVAAPSTELAAKLLFIDERGFKNYSIEAAEQTDRELALAHPLRTFWRPRNNPHAPWKKQD